MRNLPDSKEKWPIEGRHFKPYKKALESWLLLFFFFLIIIISHLLVTLTKSKFLSMLRNSEP